MYYFSELALTLNALEEGIAPTDSRMRPDQRLMENGNWDEANAEKQRLEEKQRIARRRREAEREKVGEDGKRPYGVSPIFIRVRSTLPTGGPMLHYFFRQHYGHRGGNPPEPNRTHSSQ